MIREEREQRTRPSIPGLVMPVKGEQARMILRPRGLSVDVGGSPPRDAPGVLAIRPEKVEFVDAAAPGGLAATISDVTRLAGMIEYVLTLETGDAIMVREQRRPGVEERPQGSLVAVRWRPQDVHFFAD